jgi:hypothetical protein
MDKNTSGGGADIDGCDTGNSTTGSTTGDADVEMMMNPQQSQQKQQQ